jgi:drug/metabolite transporter (DMT)-like permease
MRRAHQLDLDHSNGDMNGGDSYAEATMFQREVNRSLRQSNGLLPLPGRTRRKRLDSRQRSSFSYRFYARWLRPIVKNFNSVLLAVALWYSLGVISIGSSKILLMKHEDRFGSVPPLYLTFQQLLIGSTLLRTMLRVGFMGSSGIQPWPGSPVATRYPPLQQKQLLSSLERFNPNPSLVFAAVYFTLGFLATNYGFSGSSAAFVETIKASEPITSASVAVWWGIETLSKRETSSLLLIVFGVLLSTVGNYDPREHEHHQGHIQSSLADSVTASLIVIASNLCFSFRGLHQKLFRATPEGSAAAIDDLNLQFRMQQLGVILLIIPVLVWDMPSIVASIWTIMRHEGIIQSGILWRYITTSLINGCAFTCYNLASTYILTRISVVHHAALNCIRRIFAIIVTSIFFGVPITATGVIGILFSFAGFMAFSHFKVKRQSQPKQLSSLLPVSAMQQSNHKS